MNIHMDTRMEMGKGLSRSIFSENRNESSQLAKLETIQGNINNKFKVYDLEREK